MLNVAVNPTIALVNVENGNPLTVEESKATILAALHDLTEKHPAAQSIKTYEERGKATVPMSI